MPDHHPTEHLVGLYTTTEVPLRQGAGFDDPREEQRQWGHVLG